MYFKFVIMGPSFVVFFRLNSIYRALDQNFLLLSSGEKEEKNERIPTRDFFKDDTECYIMDAKSMGNLGRYLNVSLFLPA